jgi:hypothetical protein
MTEFGVNLDRWDNAKIDAESVPTTAKRNERNRVMKEAKRFLRAFVNRFLRYDPVTNLDRDAMGIPNHDKKPSPRPDPADFVEFELRIDGRDHSAHASFRVAGSESRGKGSYHGVEVRVWVLPLGSPAPLTAEHPGWRSEISTATPWSHTFGESEIGQRLFIAMRWENPSVGKSEGEARGDGKGPWSAIESIMIA